jgi:hypothetical protein
MVHGKSVSVRLLANVDVQSGRSDGFYGAALLSLTA